jgi:hypothetical protein
MHFGTFSNSVHVGISSALHYVHAGRFSRVRCILRKCVYRATILSLLHALSCYPAVAQPLILWSLSTARGTAGRYLGMSGRDPSSHWCEDMVIKIELPDHKMAGFEQSTLSPIPQCFASPVGKCAPNASDKARSHVRASYIKHAPLHNHLTLYLPLLRLCVLRHQPNLCLQVLRNAGVALGRSDASSQSITLGSCVRTAFTAVFSNKCLQQSQHRHELIYCRCGTFVIESSVC